MPENPDVKQWLAAHGLTQAELAARLPVKLETVSAWVRNRNNPPAYLWRALEHLALELQPIKKKAKK